MTLAVGNIVKVILEESFYENEQGEIVEIKNDGDPDGPIGVKFGEWRRHVLPLEGNVIIVRFEESNLQEENEWTLEVRAIRYYGRRWHSLFALKEHFNPQKTCGADGCSSLNVRRGLINIWGTVYEIDLCDACAKVYHGKCGEDFPRKAAEPLVV